MIKHKQIRRQLDNFDNFVYRPGYISVHQTTGLDEPLNIFTVLMSFLKN